MRGYVTTRWGQLHYSDEGSGDRTVVLFHETPLDHNAYQRLVPRLTDTFRTIAFDTPGYGESDAPAGITTIEEYVKTFVEGLDALGLDKVTVFGVHTGASYAVELAATVPDRVEAVVLNGVPFYEEEVRQAKVVPAVPDFVDDGSHLVASFNRPPREYDNELLSRMAGSVAERPDRVFWAYQAVYDYRPDRTLPLIKAPTLILSNELDVLYEPDNRALRLIPGAQQVLVPGRTLPIYWSLPDQTASEIKKFLTTL
ncbi:alpha/beta fold hydrolase [Rhodococcus koreensis]